MKHQEQRQGEDPERRPLLLPNQPVTAAALDPTSTSARAQEARRRRILIIICKSIVAANFAILLSYAPQLAILESLICRDLCAAAAIPGTMHNSGEPATANTDYSPPPTETSSQLTWTHSQWWRHRCASLQRCGLISTNVLCILGSFLMASIGRQALQLIVQYASNRFSWSIAGASLVITFRALIKPCSWLSCCLGFRPFLLASVCPP
jgi:hypothetical protein